MTVAQQMHAFAVMALCGACVGTVHDLLAVFRRGTLSAAAADLVLSLIGAAGVIAAALLLRCEPFRLYTLLGVCFGWVVYSLTLGTIVRILTKSFIKLSNKVTINAKKGKIMQEKEK